MERPMYYIELAKPGLNTTLEPNAIVGTKATKWTTTTLSNTNIYVVIIGPKLSSKNLLETIVNVRETILGPPTQPSLEGATPTTASWGDIRHHPMSQRIVTNKICI